MGDERRALQGHSQGAAHQLGGVGGHDPQDVLGEDLLFWGQRQGVDAPAELVGHQGALVWRRALHQGADVVLGERGPRRGHVPFPLRRDSRPVPRQ